MPTWTFDIKFPEMIFNVIQLIDLKIEESKLNTFFPNKLYVQFKIQSFKRIISKKYKLNSV